MLSYRKGGVEVTKEYKERKTKEAKVAKDADLVDQILLLKEYAWRGNSEAEEWLSKSNSRNRNSQTAN